MEALQKAISILSGDKSRGGGTTLAEAIGVGQSRLSMWVVRGSVPPEFIVPICRAVDFKVTPHEFSPDLYPNPTDGLPTESAAA